MSSLVNKSGVSKEDLELELHKKIKTDIENGLEQARLELEKINVNIELDFFFQYYLTYQDVYKALSILQHQNLLPPKLASLWIQKWFKDLIEKEWNEWDKVKRNEWLKFKEKYI